MKRRITVLKATSVMFAAVLMATSCEKSVDADIEKINESTDQMRATQSIAAVSSSFEVPTVGFTVENERKDFRLSTVKGVRIGDFSVIADKHNLARIQFNMIPGYFVPENIVYEAGLYRTLGSEPGEIMAKLNDVSVKQDSWSNFPVYTTGGGMIPMDKLKGSSGLAVQLFREGELYATGEIKY